MNAQSKVLPTYKNNALNILECTCIKAYKAFAQSCSGVHLCCVFLELHNHDHKRRTQINYMNEQCKHHASNKNSVINN